MQKFSDQRPESDELATLRHICSDALKQIEKSKEWFSKTCEARDLMRDMSDRERLAVFGKLIEVGKIVANSKSALPETADQFIRGLELRTEAEKPRGLSGLMARLRGTGGTSSHNSIRERVTEKLEAYPEFDGNMARSGIPQYDDFMESFSVDFAVMVEVANAMRRPFSFMSEVEGAFFDMVKIYDEFEALAFEGIDRDLDVPARKLMGDALTEDNVSPSM